MKIDLVQGILHTKELSAERLKNMAPEIPDSDAQNLEKIYSLMDGQKAILLSTPYSDDEFTFLGLVGQERDREVSYLMEQDSWCGCYIGERAEFDQVYDSGDYSRDVQFCIESKYVEIIQHKETGR